MNYDQPPADYRGAIRDLPADERPRERLRDHGASALSSHELLAILLRTGSRDEDVVALAKRIISTGNGLAGLAQATFAELLQQKGVGEAKAAEIMAAMELGKRLAVLPTESRARITCGEDVSNLLSPEMVWLSQESFRVLLLNTRHQVLGIREITRGTVNSALVRAAEVFRDAVRENCTAIIIAHNHPSGDPTPSNEDVQVTGQLFEAGKQLDIDLLDHVVVARDGFVSMSERGLGFPGGRAVTPLKAVAAPGRPQAPAR